jgi:hypothetical protein
MQIHTFVARIFKKSNKNNCDKKYAFIDDCDCDIVENENECESDLEDISNMSISKLLNIANHYCAYMSGYTYKLSQIKKYDWLSQENLQMCIDRIKKQISGQAEHEQIVNYENDILEQHKKQLVGSIDCIDGKNIWEIKCVKELKDEHYLQLAIYAHMMNEIINKQISLKQKKIAEINSDIDKIKENIKEIDNKYVNYQLKINDIIIFNINNNKEVGVITYIFKNNKINVRVNNKVEKIEKNSIICYDKLIQLSDKLNKLNEQLINKLNEEHKLNEQNDELKKYMECYNYYLFNILTDEIYQISASPDELKLMVDYLIDNKLNSDNILSDKDFLIKINAISSIYI